ncbi:MAG: serine/threonine-protein kinase [Pirellulaceae bacterium]
MANCPSHEKLQQWLEHGDQLAECGQHVDTCQDCQTTIEGLLRNDQGLLGLIGFVRVGMASRADSSMAGGDTLAYGIGDLPERFGVYRLAGPIGRGGMGRVFAAEDTELNRRVAVKLLAESRLANPQALTRFIRERQAAARILHPHVVTIFAAGEQHGQPYMAMELLVGATVGQLVQRLGKMSVADACEIARQAALGLQAIAEQSLVHRDIKPNNIMVTNGGIAKLLDLGLAHWQSDDELSVAELTTDGVMLGTLPYMAPEQFDDPRQVDVRSDLYSLGCTLFYMLTGQSPYDAGSSRDPRKWAALRQTNVLPRLKQIRPDLPRPLLLVVGRLLATLPAERPASAEQVANELATFASGANLVSLVERWAESPTGDNGTSGFPSFKQTARPLWAMFGVGVLISVSLAMFWGIWLMPPSRSDPTSEASSVAPHWHERFELPEIREELLAINPRLKIPPSLEDWINQRKRIITVSRSAQADFHTIQEAVAALNAHEAIELLDEGPYDERVLIAQPPEDTGIFSRVGAVISPSQFEYKDGIPAETHRCLYVDGFRIAGLRFIDDTPHDTHVLQNWTCRGLVVEHCDFVRASPSTGPPSDHIVSFNIHSDSEHPTVLRHCVFLDRIVAVYINNLSGVFVFHHNVLRSRSHQYSTVGFSAVNEDGPKGDFQIIGRYNVIEQLGKGTAVNIKRQQLEPRNLHVHLCQNTFPADSQAIFIRTPTPDCDVTVQRNLYRGRPLRVDLGEFNSGEFAMAWNLGYNAYPPILGGVPLETVLSSNSDIVGTLPYLSNNPLDVGRYLRLKPDSAPARMLDERGLDSFAGALPPGDASAEDDWFTRSVRRLQAHGDVAKEQQGP